MKKYAVTLCLVAYICIIALPSLIHGYIYPNMGDDFATHTKYLLHFNLWDMNYLGYAYIGYPLNFIMDITGIPMWRIFLVFNVVVMIFVGLTFYYILSRLVDYKAGLFALPLTFLCSFGLIAQYDFGMIFNVINVAIILPFFIYFTIRWYTTRKNSYLITSLVLAFLFSNFHMDGIYLSPIVCVALFAYYVFQRYYKKQSIDYGLITLLLAYIAIGVIGQYLLTDPIKFSNNLNNMVVANQTELVIYFTSMALALISFVGCFIYYKLKHKLNLGIIIYYLATVGFNLIMTYLMIKRESVHIVYSGVENPQLTSLTPIYIISVLNVYVIALLGISIYFIWKKPIEKNAKYLLFALSCVAIVWLGFIISGIGATADRTLYDLATILALITAIVASIAFRHNKGIVFMIALVIMFGMYNTLPQWFRYHSTVTQADKEAIAYLNTLDYQSYTTDHEVQPSIYDMYIKPQYKEDSNELLITRNEPMTLNSNITTHSYIPHGIDGMDGFVLDKTFNDGKIEVSIYRGE